MPSRRAAAPLARAQKVPDVPIRSLGPQARMSSSTSSSDSEILSFNRARSFLVGGSPRRYSLVSRPTPRCRLKARVRPKRSPTESSRLPPPKSAQSAGPGSISTLARTASKISCASRMPLITSMATPVASSIRSATSGPLTAWRIAAVAMATISSTCCACAMVLSRRIVSIAAPIAASLSWPSRATASPSRSISFSRASGTKLPSGLVSTTSRWNELLPRSNAAIRTTADQLTGSGERRLRARATASS